MDQVIDDLDELKEKVASVRAALLYFSGPECNVCKVLRPKLMEMAQSFYPEMERYYIDIATYPAVGAAYSVFAMPTVVIFLEGHEFARKSRAFSPAELMHDLERPWSLMMD